jgi:hypothetical protein
MIMSFFILPPLGCGPEALTAALVDRGQDDVARIRMIVIPLFLHLEHSEAMDRFLWDVGAA